MENQKKILIVEDEKGLRDVIAEKLRSRNFMPLEAADGKEGVEMALARHPDLILLDLLMPVMDGMTALKKIREDAWGATVPVIILTNLSATTAALVEDMVAYKPMYYLVKSDLEIENVIKKIEDVLAVKT